MTFVLIGTMVFLNLFIGVIMSGMDEARMEAANQAQDEAVKQQGTSSVEDIEILAQQLEAIQTSMVTVKNAAGFHDISNTYCLPERLLGQSARSQH